MPVPATTSTSGRSKRRWCAPVGGCGQGCLRGLPRQEVSDTLSWCHEGAAAARRRLALVLHAVPKVGRGQAEHADDLMYKVQFLTRCPHGRRSLSSPRRARLCGWAHLLLQGHAGQWAVLRQQVLPVAGLHRHHQGAVGPLGITPASETGRAAAMVSQQMAGAAGDCLLGRPQTAAAAGAARGPDKHAGGRRAGTPTC